MIVGLPHVRTAAAVFALIGATAAGCGGEVRIRQADVETQAKRAAGHLIGRAPDAVTCPGDMVAEVGHSMRCILYSNGSQFGVTITITSMDAAGQNAKFAVALDKAPIPT